MASEKIIKIFKDELPRDLKRFELSINDFNHQSIYDFSHKYKLRLFYLNYETCLILCNQVVDAYKNQQFEQQLNSAKELYTMLKTINDKLEM